MHFVHTIIKSVIIILICHTALFAKTPAEPPVNHIYKGEIIANILNVRAKPGVKYEVVCQLNKGDNIEIKETQNEWLGINAPQSAEAWISKNKLDADNRATENILVYSGPGTIFSTYTTLAKNSQVEILKTYQEKWVKIYPPENAIVWVHGNYVRKEIDPQITIKKTNVVKELKISEKEQLPAKPTPTNPDRMESPKDGTVVNLKVTPLQSTIVYIGKSKKVEKTGTIVMLDENHKPFMYALAIEVDTNYYPLAYLNSGNVNLENWTWETVKLAGNQRWLQGWPRPVINIDVIDPIQNP